MSKRSTATAEAAPATPAPEPAPATPTPEPAPFVPKNAYEFRLLHQRTGRAVFDDDMNRWLFPDGAQMTDSEMYPQYFEPAPAGSYEFLSVRKRYLELKMNDVADRGGDSEQLKKAIMYVKKLRAELDDVERQLADTPQAKVVRQRAEQMAEQQRELQTEQRKNHNLHRELISHIPRSTNR